jgi:hypothetical protein
MSDATARAARGSLSGRWSPRTDGWPNLRGAITLERDLPAGSKLWLNGWTRQDGAGGEFVSLSADVARGGPRRRGFRVRRSRDVSNEPEGKFRSIEMTVSAKDR